ncbi:MAG: AAA family ATPase [Candidatus Omnitrophota bacterium]
MVKSIFQRDNEHNNIQAVKTIAFVHHKGGTGKTTSCLNVAGWLVKMNKKVMVLDLDPQGNATTGLGIDRKTIDSSIADVFLGQTNIEEIILETDSGVYLAPSSLDLLAAETHMAGQANNTRILTGKIDGIQAYFDYILIDVPPGSTFLMINGMVASKNIIIPLDSGVFAYEAMETLKTLVIDLHEEIGVETNVLMVLLREYSISLFDKFLTREARNLLKRFLKTNLSSHIKIFTLPFSRKIHKAQIKGIPISHYAPFSDVGRAYKRITKEILSIN